LRVGGCGGSGRAAPPTPAVTPAVARVEPSEERSEAERRVEAERVLRVTLVPNTNKNPFDPADSGTSRFVRHVPLVRNLPFVTRHPHGATARQGHGAGWKHEQPDVLMPRIGSWRRAPGGARQGADVAGRPTEKRPDVGPTIVSGPEPQAEASRRRRWA
jgi:hypothetical protein